MDDPGLSFCGQQFLKMDSLRESRISAFASNINLFIDFQKMLALDSNMHMQHA